MKNIHDHILDKQIANALERHEVAPSAGVWSRLARHLPFVETITKMPWFYSARNVTIVALLVSLFSFGGGYFMANFMGGSQSESFGISNQPERGVSYEELSSIANFSDDNEYARNHNDASDNEFETYSTSNALADNSSESAGLMDEDNNENETVVVSTTNRRSNAKLVVLTATGNETKSGDKNSDSELNDERSLSSSTLWGNIDYRLIDGLPLHIDKRIKSTNFEVAETVEDFAIEPKSTQKFVGFNVGMAALVFGNANDMKLSRSVSEDNKDLLSLQPSSLSYRLTGEITLGQYFGIKTGLGIRDFHVAVEDHGVDGIPAPKFASSGQANDGEEVWQYTFSEGSVRTLQVPVLAGVHYDFGKLFVEAHVGKVFVKTISTTGKSFEMADHSEGTTLVNTNGPEFAVKSLNEISGGIGYAVNNRWSLVVSPTYQFSNSHILLGENQFSPSAFGVSAGLKVSL